MEQNLRQSQQQKLLLSPQMREYLRLLHLPVADLRQAVDAVLEENPMLEEVSLPLDPEIPTAERPQEPDDEENDSSPVISGDWEESEPLDFLRPSVDFSKRPASVSQTLKDFQDSLLTPPESLFDYLEWQLHFLELSETEQRIAEQIIGNITEDGYLTATFEEIAKAARIDPAAIGPVLTKIQELDPPGVAARNLKEALFLQLQRKGSEAALAKEMVLHHLELVARKDHKSLSKIFHEDAQTIQNAVDMISRLEPKPGRSFYAEEPIAITPDVTVSTKEGTAGGLEIRMNDEFIPRLKLNPEYRKMLRSRDLDGKTASFLKEKLAGGMDFIKALELRKNTLQGITEEIVKAQPLFFTRGFSYLRPLRLKDIAERLELHESTISRAIHGKYMSTPQGTIPFKSFFSQKIETQDGVGESQKSIVEKVKALIDREDPKKPLSDQAIVKILTRDGIQIARRTVTKYRELLKILPSHLRRTR